METFISMMSINHIYVISTESMLMSKVQSTPTGCISARIGRSNNLLKCLPKRPFLSGFTSFPAITRSDELMFCHSNPVTVLC